MTIAGYTDRPSASPGERLRFMVSSDSPTYDVQIVRLIHGDPHPDGPGRKELPIASNVDGSHPGRHQDIRTGSFVRAPSPQPAGNLTSFTLHAWIFPTTPDMGRQGLLTNWDADKSRGFGLLIGADGALELWIDNERFSTQAALHERRWYLVAASVDTDRGRVVLIQRPMVTWPFDPSATEINAATALESIKVNGSPYFIGALGGESGLPVDHYNGKIEDPTLESRALDDGEIDELFTGARRRFDPTAALDFSQEISSSRAVDVSSHGLHGEVVNAPSRAVPGRNWQGDEGNWTRRLDEYGAIHFHSDDMADAGWDVDFELTIDSEFRSGIYAAVLTNEGGTDRVPFFVRPGKGRPQADILFLAPTMTYIAYSNEATLAVAEMRGVPPLFEPRTHSALDDYVADNNMRSLYDRHLDGGGVTFASWQRPSTIRPDYYNRFRGYVHGLGADLHLIDWLVEHGFEHDVATDHDLHSEGADLLDPYRVVMTGTHPEYWTEAMLDGLDAYLRGGGRLMYVGGNGFWGVVSVDPARPHLTELRRVTTSGFIWQSPTGEHFHSSTGERGGDWVSRGRSPHEMVGVGTTCVGVDKALPYERQPASRDPRAAFIFEGIGDDELIGGFGLAQGGAAGDETDGMDFIQGTPVHALLVASATGFSDAYMYLPEDVFYDQTYPTDETTERSSGSRTPIRADMVFFETASGGAVFSVGSITFCASLSHNGYDNNVSRLTSNVLNRFLDATAFV